LDSLKNKAISGGGWNIIGVLLRQGSQFIFGIFIARYLQPSEYGLLAMAMVLITILYVFVDSGYSVALIQKKNISDSDLSTAFYLNLGISLLAAGGVYWGAPFVAAFYEEVRLTIIIRTLSILLILYALTLVQSALIKRNLDFKYKARIEFVAQVLSSSFGLALAYKGFGVWALIWKSILNQILINAQLWMRGSWFPSLNFSKASFHDLFSFSNKYLASSLLERTYSQMYVLVVGKYFPAKELGLYSRAEQFTRLPSHTIAGAIMGLLLPIFSRLQDQPERLKSAAKRVLKIAMYFNINMLAILAVLARPIITVLLGAQWNGSIIYMQLLVIGALLFPFHSINVQLLLAQGHSGKYLKLEIIKKTISVPTLLVAAIYGIKAMIIANMFTSILSLLINTYYTKKHINFGLREQLFSVSKSSLVAFAMVLVMMPLQMTIPAHDGDILTLLFLLFCSLMLIMLFSIVFRLDEYDETKTIIRSFIGK
jgi:teichuronic acid exporter